MILDFTRLIITNFGSFLGTHELDLAAFGPGLHFIKGKNKEEPRLGANGCGKSMLWNALCWCLTGKTPDGRRNLDIQPRFGDKKVSVTAVTTEGSVTRTANPNSLLLNDKEVQQEQIDEFIGLNFDTFTHTVLLGQGRPLFFDLAPKAKMDLFSTVLNLERWEKRSDYADEAAKSLQERLDTLVGELSGVEAQQGALGKLRDAAKASWVGWRDAQAKAALEAVERLLRLKREREQKEDTRAGHALAYDSAGTELKAVQKRLSDLAIEREKLLEEKSEVGARLATHKEKARQLSAELGALGNTDTCPTCGQSLKGTGLNAHKIKLKSNLEEQMELLNKDDNAWEEVTNKLNHLDGNIVASRKSQASFAAKVENTRRELDFITPQIIKLDAEIAQLQEAAKKKDNEPNPYTAQVEDLRKKLKALELEHQERATRVQKLSAQIERTKFWIKGFKEVRLYIIEDVLQELELTTNSALTEIGLVDWQVIYAIEKETKSGTTQRGVNVMIQSPKDKSPVKWECWSGGEGQRLRLVGALALSEVLLARANVEPSLEILDEPSKSLSDVGIQDLIEFLAERAKNQQKIIFYCDHNAIESSRFTSTLTIIKDKNGSKIQT